MSRRHAHRADVVSWSLLATVLLVIGGLRLIGPMWADALCVVAGSMLAVSAVWRAWGLRSGGLQGDRRGAPGEREHLAVERPRGAG